MHESDIQIRDARDEELIDLRHRILRKGLARETANFAGDELSTTLHVVAVDRSGAIVGCATAMASVWENMPAWQVRGMAVEDGFRSAGIGRRLLDAIESRIVKIPQASRQLWCNARSPAVGFYERNGWVVVSEEFIIDTAGPHFKMSKLLRKT